MNPEYNVLYAQKEAINLIKSFIEGIPAPPYDSQEQIVVGILIALSNDEQLQLLRKIEEYQEYNTNHNS